MRRKYIAGFLVVTTLLVGMAKDAEARRRGRRVGNQAQAQKAANAQNAQQADAAAAAGDAAAPVAQVDPLAFNGPVPCADQAQANRAGGTLLCQTDGANEEVLRIAPGGPSVGRLMVARNGRNFEVSPQVVQNIAQQYAFANPGIQNALAQGRQVTLNDIGRNNLAARQVMAFFNRYRNNVLANGINANGLGGIAGMGIGGVGGLNQFANNGLAANYPYGTGSMVPNFTPQPVGGVQPGVGQIGTPPNTGYYPGAGINGNVGPFGQPPVPQQPDQAQMADPNLAASMSHGGNGSIGPFRMVSLRESRGPAAKKSLFQQRESEFSGSRIKLSNEKIHGEFGSEPGFAVAQTCVSQTNPEETREFTLFLLNKGVTPSLVLTEGVVTEFPTEGSRLSEKGDGSLVAESNVGLMTRYQLKELPADGSGKPVLGLRVETEEATYFCKSKEGPGKAPVRDNVASSLPKRQFGDARLTQ